MKKNILFITIIVILAAIAITVYAQAQWGCCCDPVAGSGTFESQTSCLAKNFTFAGPPPNISTTCNVMCNVTPAAPPPPPPGVPGQCGTTGYKPAPTNVVARPVKGEKAIKLDFVIPCPADYMRIYRCRGSNAECSAEDFSDISGNVAPGTTYTDSDSGLLWDQDYTYRIMAHYNVAGDSLNASVTQSAGDIECWNQKGTNVFCISRFFYSQPLIKNYLQDNGYKITSADDFSTDFNGAVRTTFNSFFEKAYFCNDVNILSRPTPAVECTGDDVCVSDGTSARCVDRIDCNLGGHFGLFPRQVACEGTSNAKKYCFLDKAKTSIDKCFPCDQQMKCNDYHSKSACERDNCGIGECAWASVFPSIGTGVCYDTRFDKCALCQANYTSVADNLEGYNAVFDACTEEKAQALSTSDNPCFFNKNRKTGESCQLASCTRYTQSQCGSPQGGIQLDSDNSIKVGSNDPCNIQVCQYTSDTGCVKNADGNSGVGWQDCHGVDNPEACERDYFPPETLPFVEGEKPGKHDYINIVVKDKTTKTAEPSAVNSATTYFCIVTDSRSCNDASQFTISTTSNQLNINDLSLQDGQDIVGNLTFGSNTLKYYSVDKYKNVEVIGKSIVVFACDKCSGPKALNVSVTNGREVGSVWYTNSVQPAITVTFNEPAQVTASTLTQGSTSVPLTVVPSSGANYQYTFTMGSALSEGTYVFALNSVDSNAVYMEDPLEFDLVIDTTPPSVSITPPDKTEFDTNTVQAALDFSEPVVLTGTTLDEIVFVDRYLKKPFPLNITQKLTTSDNASYSASLTNLREGLKEFNVNAEDYASNTVSADSTFSVVTSAPMIRMQNPSWGVASSNVFDIIFETTSTAGCKYIYDVPTPPPDDQFDTLADFDASDGIEHKIAGFNKIPFGDGTKHPVHVYCRTENFGITRETFDLSVNPSAPSIVKSFAHPDPIIEPFAPNVSLYMTDLKVQTNTESFCKYSATAQNFTGMEGYFSGFDESPKKSHSAEVNVTEAKAHTFYVACKGLNELISPTVMINFGVNLNVSFKVNSTTPRYTKDELFFLRVETNKRAFCYFGEDNKSISNCFGNCSFGLGHSQQVTKEPGTHAFYVKCNTGAGGETSRVVPVTVTVDTSPPFMLWVNDSSTLPGQPDISWYPNRLRVRFLGNDTETKVIKYYYLLETAFARETVINWTPNLQLNGTPVFVRTNLTDGTRYIFRVKPVNIVGLEGNYSSSDGVTVDTTKAPPECANGELDAEETDIDCGGICAGCAAGKNCNEHGDCDSLFCLNGTCQPAACDDGYANGQETDVDCGGPGCPKCALNKTCAEDTDCDSGKCKFGACVVPDVCENGVLDGTETDIDCGGSCPEKCTSGQNCDTSEDCDIDLKCIDNTCGEARDLDMDGVTDDIDNCLDTPAGETVDEYGCSLSQVFSCDDDIDDAWRTSYFGSVMCDGDGAPDADPDNDGLVNLEEYRYDTSPIDKDTDGDRWSDTKEIDKGTDPLDPEDHPTSILWTLFKWLLILALLAGLGFGAYYGYKKGYFDKVIEKFRKKPPEEEAPPEKEKSPEIKPKPAPPEKPKHIEKISPLRKLVRKKEEGPEEFVPLEQLKKKAAKPEEKIEKEETKPTALSRLKKLKKKSPEKTGVPKRIPAAKSDSLSKLKKLKKKRKPSKKKTSKDPLSKLKKLKKKKKKKK